MIFTGLATLAAGDTATTLDADVTLSEATLVSAGNVFLGNTFADTITLDTGGVTCEGQAPIQSTALSPEPKP